MTYAYVTKRDKVYNQLMTYEQRKWTITDMRDKVDCEVSSDLVRSVFLACVESGNMTHSENSKYYYLV